MKNIMICCDGTGGEYGKYNTNVVKIFELADKSKPGQQLYHYIPGVGTGGWDYEKMPFRRVKDMLTGSGLQENINDAYKFLIRHYRRGDRIYLFGFSSGAFTVCSLTGMLHKCGLLRTHLDSMVPYAAKMYNTAENDEIAEGFKGAYSIPCPVYFIGVWDIVELLSMDERDKFHDVFLNDEVTYGFHAIALDEKRKMFQPSLWNPRKGAEQVWFAGAHSDVGGSYDNASLSDIALRWMADKAMAKGLLLDKTAVDKITGNPLGQAHDSYSGKDLSIREKIHWRSLGEHVRKVPDGALIHESVQKRIKAGIKLLPKIPKSAKFVTGNAEFVTDDAGSCTL